MDPSNPNVLLAGMWDFRRKGWTFRSGGDGPEAPSASGLFRTSDGGATWTRDHSRERERFSEEAVRPPGGAICAFEGAARLCFVESTDSALFVSDDGGATWDKRDKSTWMVWRPFYFAHMIVDPKNPDRVFKITAMLIMSDDAGKSFAMVGGFQGAHGDMHDVWIDPTNTADRHRR